MGKGSLDMKLQKPSGMFTPEMIVQVWHMTVQFSNDNAPSRWGQDGDYVNVHGRNRYLFIKRDNCNRDNASHIGLVRTRDASPQL